MTRSRGATISTGMVRIKTETMAPAVGSKWWVTGVLCCSICLGIGMISCLSGIEGWPLQKSCKGILEKLFEMNPCLMRWHSAIPCSNSITKLSCGLQNLFGNANERPIGDWVIGLSNLLGSFLSTKQRFNLFCEWIPSCLQLE